MRRLLALLLVALICVGCGLPVPRGTTAVRKVTGQVSDDDLDLVHRIPALPYAGEEPDAILKGFLAAGPNSDIARQYLTPASPWNPTASTTVFTGDPVVKITPVSAVSADATATVSKILRIGVGGATSVPDTEALPFSLTRVDGEWRIATVPNGTELRLVDLASSFRRGLLGWLSNDRKSLVRQSVLLPTDSSSLISELFSTLADGPSLPLAAASVTSVVSSRFTALLPQQVGSELFLPLQSNGANIAADDLGAFRAQLAATLLSAEITSIAVTINGQPLLGGATSGAPITAADETNFDRDVPGSDGVAATGYLATPGGAVPLVLPAPLAGADPKAPTPSASGRPTSRPSVAGTPTPAGSSGLAPGAVITAFALSGDGQRFAELRAVKSGQQAVEGTVGSSSVVALPGNFTSLAWGADDALWLTTPAGDVFVAPHDSAPQRAGRDTTPRDAIPLRQLIIAPDEVHAVGVSLSGTLVTGLTNSVASPPSLTSLTELAPSLSKVTAVAVVGSGIDGLQLLVAATRSANPLVPAAATTPVIGLWRVSAGAPDPSESSPETLSESVEPAPTACSGGSVVGLAARPRAVELAECHDGSLAAFDSRTQSWLRVTSGLAAYPVG